MQIDYALCRSQIAGAPHVQWRKFYAIKTRSLSFIMPTICITLVLLGLGPTLVYSSATVHCLLTLCIDSYELC